MKTFWHRNLIPQLVLAVASLIVPSLAVAGSAGIPHKIAGGETRVEKTNELSAQRSKQKKRLRKPDVIYYPTPPETVAEMLRMAKIRKSDVLYDLGSGDGRIPIAAATQYGIRAIGI